MESGRDGKLIIFPLTGMIVSIKLVETSEAMHLSIIGKRTEESRGNNHILSKRDMLGFSFNKLFPRGPLYGHGFGRRTVAKSKFLLLDHGAWGNPGWRNLKEAWVQRPLLL